MLAYLVTVLFHYKSMVSCVDVTHVNPCKKVKIVAFVSVYNEQTPVD